jgi:PncC family amidohydrolase
MTEENILICRELIALLKERKAWIATAESCTGGLIAASLVGISGASEVFGSGFVTYANEAKERLLGVQHETLAQYGAVSPQTAKEMAEGAVRNGKAQTSIATTGIAGPGGGTAEKPVGLVYIGTCAFGSVKVERYQFSGDREAVRQSTVLAGLRQLKTMLE